MAAVTLLVSRCPRGPGAPEVIVLPKTGDGFAEQAGALAVTRLMSSLLFEVSALDVPVFAFAFALLLALVALASLLPARRAARVDR